MTPEQKLTELGLTLPDFDALGYYGRGYGKMKPYHLAGNVLFLSAHVPIWEGRIVYPGRVGEAVTLEQGREAARITALNVLAGIKQALGELSRVKAFIRSLNFVACAPDFTRVHEVASGMTDLLAEVLGDEKGVGGRAAIGVQVLADDLCFETWPTFEIE